MAKAGSNYTFSNTAKNFNIVAKAGLVTISGWTYGRKAMAPNYTTYAGTPSIRYTGTTNGGAAYDSTEPPTDAGSYTVTVTYPGGQTGSADFEVSHRNISGNTIFINDKLTYTGEPQTIKDITTYAYDPPLDLEVDCTITGITVTDAGDYYATFIGKRNYTGTKEVGFEVKRAELTLDDFEIPEIVTEYVYNGEPVVLPTPTLKPPKTGAGTATVYYGGSSAPPTNAGTYSITFSLDRCTNFYNPGWLDYGTLTIQTAPNPMRLIAERVTVPVCGSVDLHDYVAATVDGKALKSQTFSFDMVTAGTYKLVILKPGKYVPKIVEITVGSSVVDAGQLKLWLYGDVTYDGVVDTNDVIQMNRYINTKGSLITTGTAEEIAEKKIVCDINCDDTIDTNDVIQMNRYINTKGSLFNNFK